MTDLDMGAIQRAKLGDPILVESAKRLKALHVPQDWPCKTVGRVDIKDGILHCVDCGVALAHLGTSWVHPGSPSHKHLLALQTEKLDNLG